MRVSTTIDMNGIDKVRMGALLFVSCLLPLLYGHAIFVKQSRCAGDLSLANPDEDPEVVWNKTPPTIKYVALQAGGWAICMCIVLGSMVFFEPGCEKSLCKSFSLVMVWWQFVWYGGMLGRIDAADTFKRDLMAYFKKETIQEIVLGSIFAYLGFFAGGHEPERTLINDMNTTDKVRMGFLGFISCLLPLLYGHAIFVNQSRFAGDLSLADPNENQEDVWANTPATTKYVAIQSGGWATCMCIVMGSMLLFEPGCAKSLCKSFSLCMVFWQFVWYGGMLGRIDADGAYTTPLQTQTDAQETVTFKRDFMAYFKKETIQEIVLFSIFGFLGFIKS